MIEIPSDRDLHISSRSFRLLRFNTIYSDTRNGLSDS